MKPTPSETNPIRDHATAVKLNVSATTLDVHSRERLEYTEPAPGAPPPPPVSKRMAAWLAAVEHWVCSRF